MRRLLEESPEGEERVSHCILPGAVWVNWTIDIKSTHFHTCDERDASRKDREARCDIWARKCDIVSH